MGHEYTFYPVFNGIVVAGTPVASGYDAESQEEAAQRCLLLNHGATGTARSHASEDVHAGAVAGVDLDVEVPRPTTKKTNPRIRVVIPGDGSELVEEEPARFLAGSGTEHRVAAMRELGVPFWQTGPITRYRQLQEWIEGGDVAVTLAPSKPEVDIVFARWLARCAIRCSATCGTVTVNADSEALVLTLMREVRLGRLKAEALEFIVKGESIRPSEDGTGLSQPWPGGFFLWRDGLM